MFLLDNLNNMQIVVGVFGAEMTVSFRSFGVGSNVGIFGQFRTTQVGLETALGWSCVSDCVAWAVQNELLKLFISLSELILDVIAMNK